MKRMGLVILLPVLLAALCGCSATNYEKGDFVTQNGYLPFVSEGEITENSLNDAAQNIPSATETRKRIKIVRVSMETAEFEALMTSLTEEITQKGGYIQSQQWDGAQGALRSVSLVARIPVKESDAFVAAAGRLGYVYSRQEETQDVTLQYVDTESRIAALKTEQATLLNLLETAETLEDILSLQSRLTEVRYELESYESSLRTLENQVEYAQISLFIREVEREASVVEKGIWSTIDANLSDNFYAVGKGFEAAFVWLVSSVPYWLVILPFAAAICLVLFLIRKKLRRKKAAAKEKT